MDRGELKMFHIKNAIIIEKWIALNNSLLMCTHTLLLL